MQDRHAEIPASTNEIARQIVDAAYRVHTTLGPGLLESVYETCMCYEMTKRGISLVRQLPINIRYEELEIEGGLRLDLLVADSVVVELKAVEEMKPLFEAQLLTYLKLSKKRLGLLINFNSPLIKDGIKRMAPITHWPASF